MENIRNKIVSLLEYIYGIGIFVALFVGGASFIGYLVALIVGGTAAEEICIFIYKKIYPILFCFSSSVVILGLLKMYIAGEKSMVPSKRTIGEKKDETK